MIEMLGIGASAGCAMGTAVLYTPRRQLVERSEIEDVEMELARFEAVRRLYGNELMNLYTQTLAEMDQESANIFAMYRELSADPMLIEGVELRIRVEHVNLEYALYYEGLEFHRIFNTLEDAYMRERGTDILNVCNELIRRLNGHSGGGNVHLHHRDVIVVARSMDPAAIVSLDKNVVRGVVTENGSVFSHAAILARARGIPAVVCTGALLDTVAAGHRIAINGSSGEVLVEPDAESAGRYRAMISASSEQQVRYEAAAMHRAVTLDGHEIHITAELIRQPDLSITDWRIFDGIGLYRTEFIFMTRETLPPEEMQYEVYYGAVERAHGKDVVISIADIGGDWRSDHLNVPPEENPSLGIRGVRYVQRAKDLLRTQLRAILRASAFGRVKLLIPMVVRLAEIAFVRSELRVIMEQLRVEGIAFDENLPVGILVETPAAVMLIDSFVEECDFISIGSSDLAQYILAVDRTNPSVAHLCDLYDTAILRSIAHVAECAKRAGVPVSLCGAAAYETALLPLWAALGIGELVVPPPMAARMRTLVRHVSTRPLLASLDDIMNCENPRETRRLLSVRGIQAGDSAS